LGYKVGQIKSAFHKEAKKFIQSPKGYDLMKYPPEYLLEKERFGAPDTKYDVAASHHQLSFY
jgi:hypothetical protein